MGDGEGLWPVGKAEVLPHTLQYTVGTRVVGRKRVDLVAVAATMGHESLDTTTIYTKPSEGDAVESLSVE